MGSTFLHKTLPQNDTGVHMTNNVIVDDVLCSRVLDRLHSNCEVSASENKRRSIGLQF